MGQSSLKWLVSRLNTSTSSKEGEKRLNDKLVSEFTKILSVSSDYLLRLRDNPHSVQAGDEERSSELDRLLADEEIYLNGGALTVEEKQAILDFIRLVKWTKRKTDDAKGS